VRLDGQLMLAIEVVDPPSVALVGLDLHANSIERGDTLDRVVTVSSLSSQHDGINILVDEVRDVSHLREGGNQGCDHRLQDLGGDDNLAVIAGKMIRVSTPNERALSCRTAIEPLLRCTIGQKGRLLRACNHLHVDRAP
jgi:hypothetical protein